MTVLRMLLWAHGLRIGAALLAAVALLVIGDFAELAGALGRREDTLRLTLELYRHKLPALALQALPLALLFGVLLTLADLVKHRELLALRVAGAGPLRLALAPLLLATLLSGLALYVGDGIAPAGMRRAIEIETRQLKRWSWYWTIFHKQRSWYLGRDGALYHVGAVRDEGARLAEVTRFDQRGGRLVGLASTASAVYQGRWQTPDARSWRFDPQRPETVSLDEGAFPITEPPSHFAGILGQPEELTLAQLREAIEARRRQGRPTLPMEVELRARVAMPLLGLALVILALGFALAVRAPTGAMEAAVSGMAMAFVVWMLVAVFRALGLAGIVAPWAAAWVPVLAPSLVGLLLLVSGSRFRMLWGR